MPNRALTPSSPLAQMQLFLEGNASSREHKIEKGPVYHRYHNTIKLMCNTICCVGVYNYSTLPLLSLGSQGTLQQLMNKDF